jgi:hypothetical protein
MSHSTLGEGAQIPAPASAFVVFGVVALCLVAAATGFSGTIDRSSDAYEIGYSSIYQEPGVA